MINPNHKEHKHMNTHNMTLAEQIKTADQTRNTLALAIADGFTTQIANEHDNNFDAVKEAYLDLLADKLNAYKEQWAKEFEKEGYEYVSHAEAYENAVADECQLNKEHFEQHVTAIASTETYTTHSKWETTSNLSKIAATALEVFTDEQWAQLRELASDDVSASFNDDVCSAMSSNKGIFTAYMFGDMEQEIEHLEINLPLNADNQPLVTVDEISSISDLYLSGDCAYLDMTDTGIAWSMDVEWLSDTIESMVEEEA